MKPFLILLAVAGLLLAGLNYNASKSNTGNFVISYDSGIVTQAQASAILADLEKNAPKAIDESAVRSLLRKHGVSADRIKKIVIEPGKILLLEDPADEARARAAAEPRPKPGR